MNLEDMSWDELTKYQLGRRVGHLEVGAEPVRPVSAAPWEHQLARLLNGQEQLKEEVGRLREENRRLRAELADARRMHEGDDPAS